MTELCFYYYGAADDVARHFLYALGLLVLREPTEQFKGFYVSEKRYGQESFRRLIFNYQEFKKDEALLVFRYLSANEKEWIEQNPQVRLYVLLHKLIDLSYLHEIFKDKAQSYFVAEMSSNEKKIRPFHEVRRHFDSSRLLRLSVRKDEDSSQQKKEKFQWPVFFLLIVNALVNPIGELKRYSVHLKYSNLRVVHRSLELIIFFHYLLVEFLSKPIGTMRVFLIKLGFIFRHILLMSGFKSFGIFVDVKNLIIRLKKPIQISAFKLYGLGVDTLNFVLRSKIIFIKIGFLIRHLLLMMGFKSFGVFVDSWNFVARSRIIFIKIAYFFRHIFLMTVYRLFGLLVDLWNFVMRLEAPLIRIFYAIRHLVLFILNKSYGLFVNLFYLIERLKVPLIKLSYWLRHIVLMIFFKSYGLLVDLFYFIWGLAYYKIYLFLHYRVFYFIKYNVVHLILMSCFKIYGFFYDCITFSYRFTKLILLWPMFKIYWFSEFQYRKRIKKYFSHDI